MLYFEYFRKATLGMWGKNTYTQYKGYISVVSRVDYSGVKSKIGLHIVLYHLEKSCYLKVYRK